MVVFLDRRGLGREGKGREPEESHAVIINREGGLEHQEEIDEKKGHIDTNRDRESLEPERRHAACG